MRRGKLSAVCGPMFSGKTTYLIEVFGDGKGTVVFKPDLDTRYTKRPMVVSHDHEEIPSVLVNNDRPEEMLELVGGSKKILIDEVNFFTGDITRVVDKLCSEGRDVWIAGLSQYADGDDWEPMKSLEKLCDAKIQLEARCDGLEGKCKRGATRSYRKVASTEKVRVAGASEYGAACERHYGELHQRA